MSKALNLLSEIKDDEGVKLEYYDRTYEIVSEPIKDVLKAWDKAGLGDFSARLSKLFKGKPVISITDLKTGDEY